MRSMLGIAVGSNPSKGSEIMAVLVGQGQMWLSRGGQPWVQLGLCNVVPVCTPQLLWGAKAVESLSQQSHLASYLISHISGQKLYCLAAHPSCWMPCCWKPATRYFVLNAPLHGRMAHLKSQLNSRMGEPAALTFLSRAFIYR